MAGMEKDLKFQLELLRKLYADKECFALELDAGRPDLAEEMKNIYGWGEVFRKIDPDKMFVTDANANAWRVARIDRTDGLGCLVLRDGDKDFIVKCGRGAKKLCAFTSIGRNSFTVYIDAKNLEFFEDECDFFAANPYDMVFVTNGEIVGGVMPFVAKK